MRAMVFIVFIFSVFTFAVNAQELVPATSEDQDVFDQQLEQAQTQKPAQPVKTNPAATKERKSRFGSLVKEEASKLKAADQSTRKEMGQRVSDQRRKNPAAGGASTGTNSSGNDGKNSAPGLNDSGTRGNSDKRK